MDADGFYLIEIKRNDLPDVASPSEIFQWIKLDKANGDICQLTFVSMDSSEEIEERFFEEGFLKFNPHKGTFIEKYNSAQHALDNRSANAIPSTLKQQIQNYL